jgi:glycosyltransferase involved in cell wall biosynthesis
MGLAKLEEAICGLGIKESVTLYGWVPNEKCPLYINASDLVFNPCCLVELNDATAIFEALMCGKPVLAFKRYPWVLSNQKGGFLVDKDPEKGSTELLSILEVDSLNQIAKQTSEIPIRFGVVKDIWGDRLLAILVKVVRKNR